jgi:hypothetical protein
MAVPLAWKTSEGGLRLLTEPRLSEFSKEVTRISIFSSIGQTLYLSYNTGARRITILTTGLNEVHLCLIQHLKELLGAFTPPEPEEIVLRLLIQCFIVMRANFAMAADLWHQKTPDQVHSGKRLSPIALDELTLFLNRK